MLRHILIPTIAATLCAGEAVPASIPASLAIADGSALIQHFEASLYGAVWNDPGLAWVRQQWGEQKTAWKTAPGIDLDALLPALRGLRGEFLGMTVGASPMPIVRAQADLGAQAQVLFALLAVRGTAETTSVAGADEACRLAPEGPVLARHGSQLVLGFNCDAVPWQSAPPQADGRMVVDYRMLMQSMASMMPATERAQIEDTLRDMAPWMGLLTWDTRLVPQGMHEVVTYDKSAFGVVSVDRAQLDRFPADALAVAGVGVDMAAMWKIAGPSWLASIDQGMHHGARSGAEATQQELDALLAGLGVAGGVQQLLAEARGTIVLAVTQGVPFPGVSIVVPRSPAIDTLIGVGVAELGTQPPQTGMSTVLPVPGVPLLISLACDKMHWLLSSDALAVQAWLSGKPGGFLASATGRAMLAKAPDNAYALGGLDTAAALRVIGPYVGMGLGQARHLPNEARQAMLAALARLTRESTPSWLWAAEQGTTTVTEAEGAMGLGVMPIAIIAAIAIPNLLESRVTANEAAAGATLKSGVFAAQIQFQAGGYMDQDADNVGEYGTLAELSGRQKTNKMEAGSIKLLTGPLAAGDVANGYHFRMYLPDGTGGALTSDDASRVANAAAAQAQERAFVVYAWPVSMEMGRRMFALSADGQLRSLPWDGQEPAWNAALADGWDAVPTWPVHGRHGQPAPIEQVQDPKALF